MSVILRRLDSNIPANDPFRNSERVIWKFGNVLRSLEHSLHYHEKLITLTSSPKTVNSVIVRRHDYSIHDQNTPFLVEIVSDEHFVMSTVCSFFKFL